MDVPRKPRPRVNARHGDRGRRECWQCPITARTLVCRYFTYVTAQVLHQLSQIELAAHVGANARAKLCRRCVAILGESKLDKGRPKLCGAFRTGRTEALRRPGAGPGG